MNPLIGENLPRVDGFDKVTGRAVYTADLRVHDMLYGKVLRSPYPHAQIVHIDRSKALRMPGVVAILIGQDLNDIDPYYGHAIKDRPIVALERVRFVGEPVAAVAAESEALAEAALDAIQVEYDPLPTVGTVDAAMEPEAFIIHEKTPRRLGLFHGLGDLGQLEGNICYRYRFSKGGVEEIFDHAAHVVEGEYTFPAIYQYAMEPHAAIGHYTEGKVTIWANCQHPHIIRAEISDIFSLPLSEVRVIVQYIGGGFGSKSYTRLEPLAVALSKQAGRPVLIANSVEEAMATSRRHGMKCWMKTAADKGGRLLARQCRVWLDTGAYADNGPRVAATAGDAAPGPYRWKAVAVEAAAVYTNTSPAGSYRAFGATHLQWVGETQIDTLARTIGLNPLEIRRKNLLRRGGEVRPGAKPLDADLIGDVSKAAEVIGWDKPKVSNVGRAVSVGLLAAGSQPVSTALVHMLADGSVLALVSTTEVGQGAQTVMTQIVAAELAVSPSRVRVVNPDTEFSPFDRSTGASRSTTVAGKALQNAAIDLRNRLIRMAAELYDQPASAAQVKEGAICFGATVIPYAKVIERHFGMVGGQVVGFGEVRPRQGDDGSFAKGPVFWEVCVGAAEVQLDPNTGQLTVNKLVTVADVGRAMNKKLIEGQELGGSIQGLGNALIEEMVFDNGQLLNPTLLDYRVPGWEDLPEHFDSVLVENNDGPGPYGAKGAGEGSLAGTLGAIVGAVADLNVPANRLPLTPSTVWEALQKGRL
ncbi:MAG TPA: xanthine dehydrogenase family protein molybdopterin-binding subunit [Candidatus Fraserbacteria bacterium]|nr:xanthine dehydrogenase family protein molybdopterin-binding subunit [Candidatus Fraserbacteria bacterium]